MWRPPPGGFQWHGTRARVFLIVVCAVVERVASYVTRWKCPLCGRTFTWYPDFALPYKRYVLGFIRIRCAEYVKDPGQTYRSAVQEEGMAVGYSDWEKQLQPSTLWRWVTSLGSLPETARAALGLIKQKTSGTGIFREVAALRALPQKYRCEGRRQALVRYMKLLHIDHIYALLFGVSVFPKLATGAGWG